MVQKEEEKHNTYTIIKMQFYDLVKTNSSLEQLERSSKQAKPVLKPTVKLFVISNIDDFCL
jgi:hypothetical protein